MEGLGFRLRAEASLTTLTADVIKSSAIEGAVLDAEQVRSSIARRSLTGGCAFAVQLTKEQFQELILNLVRKCLWR
jgi:Fic family protein